MTKIFPRGIIISDVCKQFICKNQGPERHWLVTSNHGAEYHEHMKYKYRLEDLITNFEVTSKEENDMSRNVNELKPTT